ncbi:MAG: ABC transporter substrate-binding protein [Proteobacteria bacterium]|nr:ABC transporter substrate-binding protein [Pseudomonadota bacterium]
MASAAAVAIGGVPRSAAAQPHAGGTLVYANISGPGTLDPYVSGSLVELEIIHHIYEGLVEMDEHYAWKPMLASKVEASPDAKTFTFTLRKGVKFSNGKEMTSADVLASFQRYQKLSTNASILADADGFDTPDPYTFVVRLKKPNAVFLDILKSPTYPLSIMPAEEKDKPAREADVIGTGPYTLGEWARDSHLVLNRNDGYVADTSAPGPDGFAGRKTAYLDHIRYNFVPEANARVAALQSGDANAASDIPPELSKRFADRKDLSLLKVFPYCQQVFVTNSQNGPTANPLIRQAIAAAVNVDEILDATGQIAQKNASLLYAFSPYYSPEVAKPYYDQHNPAKVKELLAKAGYKGEKIVLQTNSNYAYMRDAILVLNEQLKADGINSAVEVVDWTTNASNMQRGTGNWNVSTTGFCSQPLLGPQQWRVMVYTFPQVKGDAELDAAYTKFLTSPDVQDRKAAWQEIEHRVLDQAYMIKVADLGGLRGYDSKVQDMTAYFFPRYWNVWMK